MNLYKKEEVLSATLDYFNGNDLAADVCVSKYLRKDKTGNYLELTPDDMHKRLAKEFARIEKKYPNSLSEDEIYNLFKQFEYIIPQGSPMSAIGNTDFLETTSSCFVIESPADSYGGICKTDQEQAQLMKRRGGVGFSVDTIRPRGLSTNNAAKTTDGIGIFMERFSNTTREVAQSGRRGALMETCSVIHPEAETFATIKRDKKKVTGANISLGLTDSFITAVKNNETFIQQFPIKSENPLMRIETEALPLWKTIIHSAWLCAEPGLQFSDTIFRNTPSDAYEKYISISCNPCSELNMCANDSCRLLLLNLMGYVRNPFTANAYFDFELFNKHAYIAQRLMDDLVDIEIEHIDRIIEKVKADPEPEDTKSIELNLWNKLRATANDIRRTGTGVTAVGDMLAALSIQYGSDSSIDMVESVYKDLELSCYRSSIDMAVERGAFVAFDFETEEKHKFLMNIFSELSESYKDLWRSVGRRNIAVTTTAPTGSVSLLSKIGPYFGTTSGIEPVFKAKYKRRRKLTGGESNVNFIDDMGDKWQEYDVYHNGYRYYTDVTNDFSDESIYFKSEANNINWEARVDLQAAAQKWVCHAISSTINLPEDVSESVVAAVYMRAWETGCKGLTVYRDKCRDGVLFTADDKKEDFIRDTNATKRPEVLEAEFFPIKQGDASQIVLVSKLGNKPYEVFAIANEFDTDSWGNISIKKHSRKSSARYSLTNTDGTLVKDLELLSDPSLGAITRLISLNLRHGTPIQYVVEQLEKAKTSYFSSFPAKLSRVLKKYIIDGAKGSACPRCDSTQIRYQEGCLLCPDCGFSKC